MIRFSYKNKFSHNKFFSNKFLVMQQLWNFFLLSKILISRKKKKSWLFYSYGVWSDLVFKKRK